jgi:hypothetical protein
MNIPQLRKEIEEMERNLKRKKDELYHLERNCPHNWGPTITKETHLPGGRDPGDIPGTMGIDFRPPTYIPPRTIKESMRECLICGTISHIGRIITNG